VKIYHSSDDTLLLGGGEGLGGELLEGELAIGVLVGLVEVLLELSLIELVTLVLSDLLGEDLGLSLLEGTVLVGVAMSDPPTDRRASLRSMSRTSVFSMDLPDSRRRPSNGEKPGLRRPSMHN